MLSAQMCEHSHLLGPCCIRGQHEVGDPAHALQLLGYCGSLGTEWAVHNLENTLANQEPVLWHTHACTSASCRYSPVHEQPPTNQSNQLHTRWKTFGSCGSTFQGLPRPSIGHAHPAVLIHRTPAPDGKITARSSTEQPGAPDR